MALTAAWHASNGRRAWMRHDSYEARNAGFGLVEPRLLGDTSTRVQLTYPWQDVTKTSAGVALNALRSPVADRLDVSAYTQRNVRDFHSFVAVSYTHLDVYKRQPPARLGVVQLGARDPRDSWRRWPVRLRGQGAQGRAPNGEQEDPGCQGEKRGRIEPAVGTPYRGWSGRRGALGCHRRKRGVHGVDDPGATTPHVTVP